MSHHFDQLIKNPLYIEYMEFMEKKIEGFTEQILKEKWTDETRVYTQDDIDRARLATAREIKEGIEKVMSKERHKREAIS